MTATRRSLLPSIALLLTLALAVVLIAHAPTSVNAQRLLQTREVRKDDIDAAVVVSAIKSAAVTAAAKPVARALEAQVADTVAAIESNATSSSTNNTHSATSVVTASASSTTSEEHATTEHATSEVHAKSPSLSSFTGPMIAGAVAILLIGFVIAFKNRGN